MEIVKKIVKKFFSKNREFVYKFQKKKKIADGLKRLFIDT